MYYNFYVVRASYLETIIKALDNLNADTDLLLKNVGLSRSHIDNLDHLILEYPAWALLESSAEALKLPNLGKIIGQQFCQTFFNSTKDLNKKFPTIESVLHYFMDEDSVLTNTPSFWLKEDENYIWLCRLGTPGINIGVWQMEQYVVCFLVELLKIFLGENWSPQCIKLKTDGKDNPNDIFSFAQCDYELNNKFTAIAIEKRYISTVYANSIASKAAEPSQRIPKAANVLIEKLLTQDYFGENPTAEFIANCFMINLRKLQRTLNDCGTDLSTLLEQNKKNKARKLLTRTDNSVTQIATKLGYTDNANFSRAFKRWFNLPPLKYRKQHTN